MPKDAADAESYPPELSRLPPGRHGLPREFVVHNQRERLMAGLAEAVAELGYVKTTIAHITKHAAVSRRTFYEHFEGKEDCFVAAYDGVLAELSETVGAGYESEEKWPLKVRAALAALVEFAAAEPNRTRLVVVESIVAGPAVLKNYDAGFRLLVPYLEAGRKEASAKDRSALTPATEEAVAGGMFSLLGRTLGGGGGGGAAAVEALLGDLVEFALLPYIGVAAAARVARA